MNEIQIARLEQIVDEDTYSRKNIRDKVRQDIMDSLDTALADILVKCTNAIDTYKSKIYYKSKEERLWGMRHISSGDLAIEIMIAVVDTDKPTPIQSVVAKLATYLEYENLMDGVKTGSELLAVCVDTGMYDLWTNPMRIMSLYSLEAKTIEYIEKTMYLNPMLVKPNDWTTNSDGGYITQKDSVLLGKHHHHLDEQCLDVLNIIQGIEWELDTNILKYQEISKKPLDTPEKLKNFQQMATTSRKVYEDLVEKGNKFYFTWQFDFRGRIYSKGYYCNLQSSSYKKALLNFSKKRLIV